VNPNGRPLRPAERRYLMDAARGLTAQDSAIRRGVTRNTVNTALKHAKAELGARNITHAVVLCLRHGEFTMADLAETITEGRTV